MLKLKLRGGLTNTVKRIDIASLMTNKKRLLVVGGVLVAVVLLGSFGYSQYRLLNPSVDKYQAPSILDGISESDDNYSDMTKEQIDAQLKRQIGKSVTQLESSDIKKSTFGSYDDAYKAAHALWSYGNQNKSLEAYAATSAFDDKAKTYRFHLDYAYVAVQMDKKDVALEQLASAKPGIDAETTPETKQEVVSSYEYLKALAER